ncbi:RHS repeat domain-containing protein, partial [Flavobacterium oreochromis]
QKRHTQSSGNPSKKRINYYPFGSLVPNRHGSSKPNGYRYGFNGKEDDWQIKGEGNSYDFGARFYDSRIGRWFVPDKLEGQYPSYSTYNYTLNNPIYFIDPNGKGPFDWYKNKYGNYVYDKNVKSQADVGDKGTYKGDVVVLNQQTSKGQWMNTFQLNADGSVVDSFGKNYMDNFGEFTIGSSGVKVINEHTFEEKWEEYVTDNLYRASDWMRSIESDKLFKSSNAGIKIRFEFNKYSWESQVGIYSSSENSAGFYNTNEFGINGKLSTEGFNIFNYVPTPTLQFIAKLNTTNPFEPSKFVNENKVKSTASGKIPGMPFHATYEFEGNLTAGAVNQSVGIDAGIGSGNKIENGVSNTTSNMNVSKEAKFD